MMSNIKESKSVETLTTDLSISTGISEEDKKLNEILKNRLRKYIKKLDGKLGIFKYCLINISMKAGRW